MIYFYNVQRITKDHSETYNTDSFEKALAIAFGWADDPETDELCMVSGNTGEIVIDRTGRDWYFDPDMVRKIARYFKAKGA